MCLTPAKSNVHQPEFFKTAERSFQSTPMDDWKAYLRWHLINDDGLRALQGFRGRRFQF